MQPVFNCPQDRVGIVERADQSKRRRFQSQHIHNHRHHGTVDDGNLIHSVRWYSLTGTKISTTNGSRCGLRKEGLDDGFVGAVVVSGALVPPTLW